ncbi:MAG: transposase, partial [Methylococcales bacterium]
HEGYNNRGADNAKNVFQIHGVGDQGKVVVRKTLNDRQIAQLAASSEPTRRLMSIEGIGPLTATAVVASVGDARVFENGRQFAAWLGRVPRQYFRDSQFRLGAIAPNAATRICVSC